MEQLLNDAKNEIPSVDDIMDKTWRQLDLHKSKVKNNFGLVLVNFDEKATEIFKEYEHKALTKLAKLWLNSQQSDIRKRLKFIIDEKGWDKFI